MTQLFQNCVFFLGNNNFNIKQKFGNYANLAQATQPRTHASRRLASEQVSSKSRTSFGPASIMDFGLYWALLEDISDCGENIWRRM